MYLVNGSTDLLPYEIRDITDGRLAERRFTSICTTAFLTSLRDFIENEIVSKLAALRKVNGLASGLSAQDASEMDDDSMLGELLRRVR